MEAYNSPFYHPMAHGMALEGMRLVKDYLPRLMKDGTDMEARSQMMVASHSTSILYGYKPIHRQNCLLLDVGTAQVVWLAVCAYASTDSR